MNREKRKQLLQLKPFLDKLETRRLMSLGGAKARLAHDAGAREDGARVAARRRRPGCVRARAGPASQDGGRPWARRPVAGAAAARGVRRSPRLGGEPGQRADRSPQVRGRPPPDGGPERATGSVRDPATPPAQTVVDDNPGRLAERRPAASRRRPPHARPSARSPRRRSSKTRSRSPSAEPSTSRCRTWAWERPA